MKNTLKNIMNIYACSLAIGLLVAAKAEAADEPAKTHKPMSLLDIDLKLEDFGFSAGGRMRFTRLDNENAALAGGAALVTINRAVAIGYAQYQLVNTVDHSNAGGQMVFGLKGLLVEIGPMNQQSHTRFDVYVASVQSGYTAEGGTSEDIDSGIAIEPAVGWGLNLFSWVRLEFGVGYRFVNLTSGSAVPSRKLTGASGYVGLTSGWF